VHDAPTRRALLAIAFVAASLVPLECSGDSGSNASTATDAAEFDVTRQHSAAPADARRRP
jgi:hypothetical protein